MDHEKRVQYTRLSLGLCGIGVSNATAEIVFRVNDAILEMEGDFDLITAAKIQTEVEEKYARKFIPSITIDGLEKFYDDTVNQLHTRNEEDPLTIEMVLNALKNLIETNREIPI
jgi:hypothetical protein